MTTSVTTIVEERRNYVQRLLAYLDMNNKTIKKKERTGFELETSLIVTEFVVNQALLGLEEVAKLDMLLHRHAASMPEEAWVENDEANQQLFEVAIHFGKAALATCERLQQQGLTVEKQEQLAARVAEFERDMNWSVSNYADLPAFQKFMKAAVAEYKAGKVEEGGWQL